MRAGPSGRPPASTGMIVSPWLLTATAARLAGSMAAAATAARTARTVADQYVSGSSWARSGLGWSIRYSCEPTASWLPAASKSAALTEVVPTSRPSSSVIAGRGPGDRPPVSGEPVLLSGGRRLRAALDDFLQRLEEPLGAAGLDHIAAEDHTPSSVADGHRG